MTTLYEVFSQIAPALGVDADTLVAYAQEDAHTGYHHGGGEEWPAGSIWAVEGYVLYAIVRALKPDQVLEIGTNRGCSATHILTALADNKHGLLESIDIWDQAGDMIPDHLRWRWRFTGADALKVLANPLKDLRPSIVFEDGPHDTEFTTRAIALSLMFQPKVIISHDACHPLVGEAITAAWDQVFGVGNYHKVLIPPSDCGLAIWVREE